MEKINNKTEMKIYCNLKLENISNNQKLGKIFGNKETKKRTTIANQINLLIE